MIKYFYVCLIVICFSIFSFFYIKVNSYIVVGSGEGAIMLDAKTGEAWVLEAQNISFSAPTSNLLKRDQDFCSPKGMCYYWVPTAVIPCYSDAQGIGRTPKEANESDQNAMFIWESKLDRAFKSSSQD